MMPMVRREKQCPFQYPREIPVWLYELESLQVDIVMLDPVADHREVRIMGFMPGWMLDFRSRETVIYVRNSTDPFTGCAHQGLC